VLSSNALLFSPLQGATLHAVSRGLAKKHGKRLKRAKRDEFERHHARLSQRQHLQKLIGFGTLRHVS
jgi:hypothetical protein